MSDKRYVSELTLEDGNVYHVMDVEARLNKGDGNHQYLTYAEYLALSDELKNDGTIYFITDMQDAGTSWVAITKAAYLNLLSLGKIDPNTVYFITDADSL